MILGWIMFHFDFVAFVDLCCLDWHYRVVSWSLFCFFCNVALVWVLHKLMGRSCFGLELLVLFSWRMRGISLFLLPFLFGLMQYVFGDYDRSPSVAGCASQFFILCFFLNLEWLYLFFFVCNYDSICFDSIDLVIGVIFVCWNCGI